MSYEVRDNWGRKVGTVRAVDDSWTCCVTTILCIVGIIGLSVYGVYSLTGWMQSQNLPIHDSLTNIKTSSAAGCLSDGSGYHVSGECEYSGVEYGDVDISVTTKLTIYTPPSNSTFSAYGIGFRGSPYAFVITPDGQWFFELGAVDSYQATPSNAIRKGVGATNTLEARMHGSHFVFLVNGVQVDKEDDTGVSSTGPIIFYAQTFWGDPTAKMEAVFTNLTIDHDPQ